MEKEDYPSDSDQSDDDFCPGNVSDDDELSEEESNDSNEESDENEPQDLKDLENRKKHSNRSKKKPVKQRPNPEEKHEGTDDLAKNDEAEKKRSDALWADFLSDVNESSKESGSTMSRSISVPASNASSTSKKCESSPTIDVPLEPPKKKKITELFEFAGEKVEIVKEVPVNEQKEESHAVKEDLKNVPNVKRGGPLKRPSGGLGSVLNAINKKNKLSVLDKSKMDWDSFKQSQGLSEELKTHNKGRDGYLERQDFLQRTDVRQFEVEKNLRQSRRSKR